MSLHALSLSLPVSLLSVPVRTEARKLMCDLHAASRTSFSVSEYPLTLMMTRSLLSSSQSGVICSAVACLCSYIFPPLGVYWKFGCGTNLLINVILCCLGYLPGIIHAIFLIGCEGPSKKDYASFGAPLDLTDELDA